MSDGARTSELPIFSPRLDELMDSMLNGEAPNVGRFCGYCYTPLGRKAGICPHCQRSTAQYEPVAKIPTDFFVLYKRMRRRESVIVNSFAFAGLGLALVVFIAMVAIAVYLFNASLWWMAAATVVLIVGGRVFAGILGGWIGDSIGYNHAQRKLAVEWAEYESAREARRTGVVPSPEAAPAAGRA